MATQSLTSINKSKRSELDSILSGWESRYKLRLLSLYLPRAIIAGLVISIVIGVIGYSQRLLYAQNLAVMTLAISGIAGLLAVLYVQLFPRQRQATAQYFDIEFGLKERVSAALELIDGRIQTHPEIESMQLADALQTAHAINPQQDIQMDFRQREIIAMGVLLVAALAMILVPLIVGQAPIQENPSAAVRAAQEDVREMIETVATDTDLDEIDRDELLNALEIALERLEEEDISDEEAFAAMSQLESEITEVENELQDTLSLNQSSLESASESLGDYVPPSESQDNATTEETAPMENTIPAGQQLQQALDQMADDAQTMSEEEAQAAADALRDAAEELAESNPELAQSLRDASDAFEIGDNQTAQEQLDNAQQQLQQQQQQMQQNSDAQQMLQDQSDMTQSSMDEISQQQSEQSPQTQQQSDSQSEQAQQGESESQNSNQQSGQPGDQSESSQPGDPSNGQQPNSNQPGESASDAMSESDDSSGPGAGEGEASNTAMSGSGGEDQGADTNNQVSGEGQIEYEAIYDPTGITGGGNNDIELETDSSNQPITEGDFDDNPFGQSQVSYDTVFSDYQDAANRALESDYVPLGLRDVVRDYFTSLEPAGDE